MSDKEAKVAPKTEPCSRPATPVPNHSSSGEMQPIPRSRENSFVNTPRSRANSFVNTPRHSSEVLLRAYTSNSLADAYDKEGAYYNIRIQIAHPSQLFVSYDPSPVYQKTLRDEVEDYIVSCIEDIEGSGKDADHLPSAVMNWFKYRELVQRRKLTTTLRHGRKTLLAAVIFLFVTLLIASIITLLAGRYWPDYSWTTDIFCQMLTIIGWVAMWEPVTLLLHTWRPIYGDMRNFRRISEELVVEIEFHHAAPIPDSGGALVMPVIDKPVFSFGRVTPQPRLASNLSSVA